MPTDFLRVMKAFQDARVRYVLVGGLAVLLHGVDRLTADIDLVVLSFWDPQNRCPTVDLFADYPMEFKKLYAASVLMPLSGTDVHVACIDHLIEIKRAAGRPQDLEDAARLMQLRDR